MFSPSAVSAARRFAEKTSTDKPCLIAQKRAFIEANDIMKNRVNPYVSPPKYG